MTKDSQKNRDVEMIEMHKKYQDSHNNDGEKNKNIVGVASSPNSKGDKSNQENQKSEGTNPNIIDEDEERNETVELLEASLKSEEDSYYYSSDFLTIDKGLNYWLWSILEN